MRIGIVTTAFNFAVMAGSVLVYYFQTGSPLRQLLAGGAQSHSP